MSNEVKKYYLFKSPYHPGDEPLEEFTGEPIDFIIEQRALKYGAVTVKSEDDL